MLEKLTSFDQNQIVWVESESNKIGAIYLPTALWQKMKDSTCVEVKLSLAMRVKWLLEQYPELMTNPEILKQKLRLLKRRYGTQKLHQWFDWIDQENFTELVEDLLRVHYDPAYCKSLCNTYQFIEHSLTLENLSSHSIETFQRSLKGAIQHKMMFQFS